MILVTRSFQITPDQDAKLNRLASHTSRADVVRTLIDAIDESRVEIRNVPGAEETRHPLITIQEQIQLGQAAASQDILSQNIQQSVQDNSPLAEILDAIVTTGVAVTTPVEL